MAQGPHSSKEMDVYDITIIGAGPTGLFGAFYAGLRDMKAKVIEALPEVGGQLLTLYPEKFIYDVPGYPKILAKDLVGQLLKQALQFNPTLCLNEWINSLRYLDGGIIELESDKAVHHTRAVLICAGIGAFAPNKLAIPSAQKFEGRGVYYYTVDRSLLRGKRVLVIGGGDSSVDWALALKDWATKVTLIHRRAVFRAHESSVAELLSTVEVKLFHELKEVHGDDAIKGVTIFNNKTGEEVYLDVDVVLINIGFKADLGPMRGWGLEFENRTIRVNGRMETNLPGVYAVGDVAQPKDTIKLNLIATGLAQAAIAVNYAKNYVDPKAGIVPGHSSEKRLYPLV